VASGRAQGFELWTSTPEEYARVIKDRSASKLVKSSGARID
jgi:hypothetical protein